MDQRNRTKEKIYDEQGVLLYEGFTRKGKPYGAGIVYYPDGTIFQEGVFDINGLVAGSEYYPDGEVHFQGMFRICRKEGVNDPAYGTLFTWKGEAKETGEFPVGKPTSDKEAEKMAMLRRNNVPEEDIPKISYFTWDDEIEEAGELERKEASETTHTANSETKNEEKTEDAEAVWGKLYDEEGRLRYEGFVKKGKPYSAGTTYFASGAMYQEGIFNIKGLVCGREYYPNGQRRFEGIFSICHGYGPNYPIYGDFYTRGGTLSFSGKFWLYNSNVGRRTVARPEGYGGIPQSEKLGISYYMWEGDRDEPEEEDDPAMMTMPTFEEFEQLVQEDLREKLRVYPKNEVEAYLVGEDVTKMIDERYEEGVEKYRGGRITGKVFRIGIVSSTTECLSLMF